MIPIWQHVLVVIAMLIAHGLTVRWGLRRIRGLQAALVAKQVLLAGVRLQAGVHTLTEGHTFTLMSTANRPLLTVENNGSICTVRTFDE